MHKVIKWNRDIPHISCACEVSQNITLIIRALNQKLAEKLLEDLDKVIAKFTCSKEHHISSCMQGTYTLCSKIEVDIANDNSQSSDSELDVSQDNTSSDKDFTSTVKHYKWATINSKVQKWAVEIDLQDDNEILNKKFNIPKQYIYFHREQYRKYNE